MLTSFFHDLKDSGLPVSLLEFITFLKCLQKGVVEFKVEKFYFLAKASLVKHEKHLDTFDQVFGKHFNGNKISW
jgi:uncharacterized protein with von Willebrand factor type A (vWA) domain